MDITVTQPSVQVQIDLEFGSPIVIDLGGVTVIDVALAGIQGPAGSGGGGGVAGPVFVATVVAGTANAILLTVPGLTLSAAPQFIRFLPVGANGPGGVTVRINGGAVLTLMNYLGQAVGDGDIGATRWLEISAATGGAQFFAGI